MKIIAAGLLSFFMLTQAHAQPEVLGVHLVSRHSNYEQNWNDTNPGLYARWSNGFTAGGYYNSERKVSAYAGWTFEHAVNQRVALAVTLGGITGYSEAILPMVIPSASLKIAGNTSARVSFAYNPRAASALHLSIERRF